MSHKNSDFQTSWNLRFSTLEPKPSLVFWLDTSVDVASDRPFVISWFDQFVFGEKFCEKILFFANRGHLQVLKVRDLKLFYVRVKCVV